MFLFLLFVLPLQKPTFVVVIPTVHYQPRCRNACLEHTLRPRAPPSCRIDLSPLDDTSSNNEPPKGLRHFGIIDANHPTASPVLDSSGYIFLLRWGLREFSRGNQPAARRPLFFIWHSYGISLSSSNKRHFRLLVSLLSVVCRLCRFLGYLAFDSRIFSLDAFMQAGVLNSSYNFVSEFCM